REELLSVGQFALPASFTLPKAANRGLPAALLIGGSGANDRDESVAGAKPFRDLAHALAKRGIATLRYEKRSFAHPEWFRDPQHFTVEDDVLGDAVAALQMLRARPEIDQKRLFLIGHSLGALLAPEVAQRGGGVAGLVLLAAPGRPLEQIQLQQLKARQPGSDFTSLERQVHALPSARRPRWCWGCRRDIGATSIDAMKWRSPSRSIAQCCCCVARAMQRSPRSIKNAGCSRCPVASR
ncbi:MAG TPA: alpha/beta fold hydrolase, partial [Polyangiaceae bacterium]